MQLLPIVVALSLCLIGTVISQSPTPQVNLYPITANGFDTVWLNDQSFCTELSFQTGGPNENVSYYVYGANRIRTVYPGTNFYVGVTPNEVWHIPFIDFHTFENGTDIWGFGPVNTVNYPLTPSPPINPPSNNNNDTLPQGYQFQIVVLTTKSFPNNPHGIFWLEQPLGFEGTYYSAHVATYDPSTIVGFFAGFFPSQANPDVIQFGVVRAHFNVSMFASGDDSGTAWEFNSAIDIAMIYNQTQIVDYNSEFKPIMIHLWNVTSDTSQSYLAVIDPYWDLITLVQSNWQDQTQPLRVNPSANYRPDGNANIVSAVAYQNLLFVGVAALGTGWIDVLNTPSLSLNATIMLPTNYSNPKALVVDAYSKWNHNVPTLYVGMNGGAAVLRINLTYYNSSYPITGYQMLPHYLHRVWVGQPGQDHIYFTTNEQHAKVFRVAKTDFCAIGCMEFGYCKDGKCVCNPGFDKKGDYCEWHQLIIENHTIEVRKGGEVTLGIFFALTFIVGAYGWYLVWQNKRSHYQKVQDL